MSLSSAVAQAQEKIVAVFPVEPVGEIDLSRDDLETSLTVYVRSRIAASGFQVVPPAKLQTALDRELKRGYGGRYNPATQVAVTEALAATQIVTTQIIKIASVCSVSITLFDLRANVSVFSHHADGGCKAADLLTSIQTALASLSPTKTNDFSPTSIKVGVRGWGGYAGALYFNDGLKPSSRSRFTRDYRLQVELVPLDSIAASVRAWQTGRVDAMWITVDGLPTEYGRIAQQDPRLFLQAGWSRGEEVMVARRDIRNLNDLRDRRIALVKNTTAHSFLLISLDLAGLGMKDVTIVEARSDRHAADLFISGRADAAIVWIDENERCLAEVDGAHEIESTEDASYLIAESLVVKADILREKRDTVARLAESWLRANAELADRRNRDARRRAVALMAQAFDMPPRQAEQELSKVRLATLGDNRNFFGHNPNYRGEKGEDLYDYFWKKYREVGSVRRGKPPWREIADDSIVGHVSLSGDHHDPEPLPDFSSCRDGEVRAPLSKKPLNVRFPTGRSELNRVAERFIEEKFGHLAQIFFHDCIQVEGNTDDTGPRALHKPLSKARADAVRRFLTRRYGFDRARVITIGNGDSKPVAFPGTPGWRARNRRTDFELLRCARCSAR